MTKIENERELEKRLQQRYMSQGMDFPTALHKASDGVWKLRQKNIQKSIFFRKYTNMITFCKDSANILFCDQTTISVV